MQRLVFQEYIGGQKSPLKRGAYRTCYIFYILVCKAKEKKLVLLANNAKIRTVMRVSEQALQQIKDAITTAVTAFPADVEALPMTDIIVQVSQDSGEFVVSDDDNNELCRMNIAEWSNYSGEDFYGDIQPVLRRCINEQRETLLQAAIMKPFSILLVDDDGETVADLYTVEDDTVVLDDEMIRKIDEDLDDFLDKLMKE